MKRDFYMLTSVLIIGIIGAVILIRLQNAKILIVPKTLAADTLEIGGISSSYLRDLGKYVIPLEGNDSSSVCSEDNPVSDEIAVSSSFEDENINTTDLTLEKPAAQAVKSVVAPIVKKPAGPYVPGIRFTNNPQQMSCHLKGHNHPSKSKRKGNHYDEDCCIDKDEWLEPGCVYLYSDLGVSLNNKKPAPLYKP